MITTISLYFSKASGTRLIIERDRDDAKGPQEYEDPNPYWVRRLAFKCELSNKFYFHLYHDGWRITRKDI